jgi:tetratricopeptide (TPR) repeat protein
MKREVDQINPRAVENTMRLVNFEAANPILECLVTGKYLNGLESFEKLEHPSAADQCWAGACLINLNKTVDALELLLLSRKRGYEDAGTFAANVLRLNGELEHSQAVLDSLNPSRLSVLGQAIAERERGSLKHTLGSSIDAIPHLEQAWELASSDQTGKKLLASFSSAIGFILAQVGKDTKALGYLNHAIETTTGNKINLFLTRAGCHMNTGRFEFARNDLIEVARLSENSPTIKPILLYYAGKLAYLQNLFTDAAEHFLECAAQARNNGESETEFYAELFLGSICTANDDLSMARAHLSRARLIADGVKMHAHLALRHGALLVRLNDLKGIESIQTALTAFENLQLEREIGLTQLHLAEALLHLNRVPDARLSLGRAVDARYALGNGTLFSAELSALPAVFEHLATISSSAQPTRNALSTRPIKHDYLEVLLEDWRALESNAPLQLSITTLGRYGLAFDSQPVKLNSGVARTVEVLAFLLEHGEATLEQLQAQVFTDVSPSQARHYIHLVRQSVTRSIPGLSIPYEPESRTYRLVHTGLRIYWDALEVRKALQLGGELGLKRALGLYSGGFMLRSEGVWAEEYRNDLEWSVASAGLATIEDLFKQERYDVCIELATRLLEISPLDVALSIFLVQAVRSLKGTLAARQELERLANVFNTQIGEVPEALNEMRGTMLEMN